MATLLTGLSPLVHGTTSRRARLPDEIDTLAERLRRAGYATAGLGLNAHLEELFHFRQGFDDYLFPARADYGKSLGSKLLGLVWPNRFPALFPSSEAIADVAVDWIEENRHRPFFLWMHVLDPHWPYEPPEEWAPGFDHPRFGRRWGDPETVTNVQAGNLKLGADDREAVRELYRGEIRYADHEVGRVLTTLQELGLYDDALIVFASDHGEEFWEHGRYEHGHALYDEVLRVPLAFKLPRAKQRTHLDVPVSTESVTPTILDVLGLAHDPTEFSGTSLRPFWESPRKARTVPLFSGATYYHGEKRAVVFDDKKLVLDLDTGRVELYDLEADPQELHSLTSSERKTVEKGLELLREWLERAAALRERLGIGPDPNADLDEAAQRHLQALGYG